MRPSAHQLSPSGAIRVGELRHPRLGDEEVHVVHHHRVDRGSRRPGAAAIASIRAGDCDSQRRLVIATTAQKLHANGQPNDELCATVRRPR